MIMDVRFDVCFFMVTVDASACNKQYNDHDSWCEYRRGKNAMKTPLEHAAHWGSLQTRLMEARVCSCTHALLTSWCILCS